MDNPYAPPPGSGYPFGEMQQNMPFQANPGFTGHVRVLGILTILQGIAATLMGLFFVVYAFVFPMIMNEMAKDPNFKGRNDPQFQQTMPVIAAIMGGFAAVIMIPGILQIVAGIKTYQFRSRTFAIAGLVLGLIPLISCYCAPTATALTVYGFIVLMNPQVIQAFEMRNKEWNPSKFWRRFIK